MNNRNFNYSFFIIAGGVLWGFISIFSKGLGALGMNSFEISFLRCFFGFILLLIFMLVKCPQKLKIDVRDIWMFFGTGCISLTVFNICYFFTIEKAGASVAAVLLYTSPIWVMLMSAVIFKEKITMQKTVALLMTLGGCVIVSGIFSASAGISINAAVIGVCSGIGYALYSIFGRFALKKYDSLTVTFYTFAFSTVTIFFTHPVELVSKMAAKPVSILWAIGMAAISAVVPYLLYTIGLSHTEPSKAAILATIEPLVAAAIGIFLWKEPAGIVKIIGMALIFASAIVLNLPHVRKKSPQEGIVNNGPIVINHIAENKGL